MTPHAWLGEPVDARGSFGPERAALLELLRSVEPGQWRRTALPGWSVRDVAAHLLGDDYARLAWMRDGHDTGAAPRPGEAFEAFIHRSNREWVEASRRISPPMLVETLELTGGHVARMWARSDLHAVGRPVSWAGADPAPLWLDCARDLTEYWTHRQQIRAALGRATEGTPPAPPVPPVVLDTFMRALPHTLADVSAPAGTRVRVVVDDQAELAWTVRAASGGGWEMEHRLPAAADPAAQVELDAATAWRLCVRAIGPAQARSRARLRGERRLAEAVCRMVSIIY
ncbi:hypothetical protein LP52_09000 [Streptomonospora alba]|uniref:Mycothiol-dependent maleylpyruvate isomerase metal-binding domain-containing protein n=1 Tax=Streptomonospora alba TaxID=183763 RepID=A0A0C2G7E9_9ACTN|nr:maleylpyruvate isomerase family mycothiol-dependent enzyme [Streptomonospora alba]KIH99238.1 hypothetical protein LP52_09000 [Streptomonospora alba]